LFAPSLPNLSYLKPWLPGDTTRTTKNSSSSSSSSDTRQRFWVQVLGNDYLVLAELHDDIHILFVLKHVLKLNNMLVSQGLVDLDLRLKLLEHATQCWQSGTLALAAHPLSKGTSLFRTIQRHA
jgi:hypothetical protein